MLDLIRISRKHIVLFAMLSLVFAGCSSTAQPGPKYVILMIGDGMGFEQVKSASIFAYGEDGQLAMQSLPVKGSVRTWPVQPKKSDTPGKMLITDSAASATAIATGVKVNNGVISKRIPGDGKDLKTILEKYRNAGRKTGLVTTVFITHATPAGFGGHAEKRGNYAEIGKVMLEKTRPNVLYGGSCGKMTDEAIIQADYGIVSNRREMQKLDPAKVDHVVGRFGPGYMPMEFSGRAKNAPGYEWQAGVKKGDEYNYKPNPGPGFDTLPHLSEMTKSALEILQAGDKGFFLMVEGGQIDSAGHANHLANNIHETLEFDKSVKAVMDWAKGRDDVLILVTADHETGGLKVVKSNGKGKWPEVTWSTGGHTGAEVPIFAWGQGAELFTGKMDNTDISKRITQAGGVKSNQNRKTDIPEPAIAK